MDNGLHGDFSLVYDGEGAPTVRSFKATNLVTGHPYRFYVVAINHVGESPESDILPIYACSKPTGV